MLGENLIEGAWFWKAPIEASQFSMARLKREASTQIVEGLT